MGSRVSARRVREELVEAADPLARCGTQGCGRPLRFAQVADRRRGRGDVVNAVRADRDHGRALHIRPPHAAGKRRARRVHGQCRVFQDLHNAPSFESCARMLAAAGQGRDGRGRSERRTSRPWPGGRGRHEDHGSRDRSGRRMRRSPPCARGRGRRGGRPGCDARRDPGGRTHPALPRHRANGSDPCRGRSGRARAAGRGDRLHQGLQPRVGSTRHRPAARSGDRDRPRAERHSLVVLPSGRRAVRGRGGDRGRSARRAAARAAAGTRRRLRDLRRGVGAAAGRGRAGFVGSLRARRARRLDGRAGRADRRRRCGAADSRSSSPIAFATPSG